MVTDRCLATLTHHGFDGGPPEQAAALFGDVAATDFLVGLVVGGGDPGPTAELTRGREPRDVTDLGHHDCRQHRADPGDGTDGLEPEIAGHIGLDLGLDHGYFPV